MTFAAYALYCLLAGSVWVAEAVLAPSWPGLLRICWHDAMVAGVFGVGALRSGIRSNWLPLMETSGWCALLFVGPALLAEGASGQVGSGLVTLGVGLVPVVTAFAAAQHADEAWGLMLPSVVGLAGLGLVLPFRWPSSPAEAAWTGATVLLAVAMGFAGFRLHDLLQRVELPWAGAVGAGAAALLTGLVWAAGPHTQIDLSWRSLAVESAWGLAMDGSLVWLFLWLVRRMDPVAFSGRFLLVPVVTLTGAILIEKPDVGWTGWLGLGLTVGASLILVRPRMPGFFRQS